MMKKAILILLAVHSLSPVTGQVWEDLLNGESLSGWVRLDGTADFRVEDGIVIGTSRSGTPNTFMATEGIYGDFILEYEMKMDRGLNSGVQFRSTATRPDGSARVNGYQVECDDHGDRPWTGGIYEEADRGWLYPMTYNPEATVAFRPGEWNHFRVEAVGSTIRTFINGANFSNLVDEARASGFIALQVHSISDNELEGREVRWRNIRILTSDPGSYMRPELSLAPEVCYLDNRLTPHQEREGWKLLWDGRTAHGWKGAGLDHFPEKGWNMENGILYVNRKGGTSGGGDIVTVDKYRDFILEVDFKYTRGANSGIKYFVDPDPETGARSTIGCEYQIIDDVNHPDAGNGIPGSRSLASLYDMIPPDALLLKTDNRQKRFNGIGQWNRARIEVRGSRVAHYLNGVKVLEYERGTQMWKALVARSKYAEYPAFGEAGSGYILLQDHGDELAFKNIRILEL